MATSNPASELFGQAARSFEAAIQTGLRLQEESLKCMTDMLSDIASPQNWQKKAQAKMSQIMAISQQSIEETIRVMNENAKTSMECLQKAFHSQPGEPKEAQAKTMEMWETALGVVRRNTEAALRANRRAVETWAEISKTNGEHAEHVAEMAQKAAQAATAGSRI
jgi:hypothetical protein